MGAWGEKPWENDTAADWFDECMKKIDTVFILDQAEKIIKSEDDDELRAVSYIIGHLGRNYIWPINEMERVNKVKEKLIVRLESMLESDSDFMDIWEDDDTVKNELQNEIKLLKS